MSSRLSSEKCAQAGNYFPRGAESAFDAGDPRAQHNPWTIGCHVEQGRIYSKPRATLASGTRRLRRTALRKGSALPGRACNYFLRLRLRLKRRGAASPRGLIISAGRKGTAFPRSRAAEPRLAQSSAVMMCEGPATRTASLCASQGENQKNFTTSSPFRGGLAMIFCG